jgi:hypothetical protein
MTAKTQRLRFSIDIQAPPGRVYDNVVGLAGYRQWTAAFMEGSTFEGSWDAGSRIRFLGPSGDGMVSEIAENRRHEHISIRHLGMLNQGVEDTTSDAVRAWAPAFENYAFDATAQGTRFTVEQDMAPDWVDYMSGAWPKALALLKALCESEPAATGATGANAP